mgnify:CR=1 FL=1
MSLVLSYLFIEFFSAVASKCVKLSLSSIRGTSAFSESSLAYFLQTNIPIYEDFVLQNTV